MNSLILSRTYYIVQDDLEIGTCLSLPGTGILGILYIFNNNLKVESGKSKSRDALV